MDKTNKLKGPTVMYGPAGEAAVFHHHDDIPEGWLDNPAKHSEPKTAPSESNGPALSMTKKEIAAALEEGGIPFNKRDSAEALQALLAEKVKTALTDAGIAFDDSADAKTLLGLLPPPE